MSDFERIKKFNSERPELPLGQGDVQWLIAEVERLRQKEIELSRIIGSHVDICEGRIKEIASLTKELAEKVQIINGHPLKMKESRQKLEAENAQIKAGWKADFNNWEKAKENNTILAVKLAFAENTMATRLARVEELYEKLTTSEKENALLEEKLLDASEHVALKEAENAHIKKDLKISLELNAVQAIQKGKLRERVKDV